MGTGAVAIGLGLAATLLTVGFGVLWVVRSAAKGEIAANGLIGLCTGGTQESEAAWRVGHAAAYPWARAGFVVAGLFAVAVALGGWTGQSEDFVFTTGIIGMVVVTGFVTVSAFVADKAAVTFLDDDDAALDRAAESGP